MVIGFDMREINCRATHTRIVLREAALAIEASTSCSR